MKTTNISNLPFRLEIIDSKIVISDSYNSNFGFFKFSLLNGQLKFDSEEQRRNLLVFEGNFCTTDLYDFETLDKVMDTLNLMEGWKFIPPESFTQEKFLEEIGVVKINDFDYTFSYTEGFRLL